METKKDTIDIEKLFAGYISGSLSEEDHARLMAWAEDSPQRMEILRLLRGESEFGADILRVYDYDQQRVWNAILKHKQSRRHNRMVGRIWRVAIAASFAVAILLSSYYIYTLKREKATENHIVSTVTPGQTGAVLELSTGETVNLSGGEARQLTEADNTQIHVADNQLEVVADDKSEQPVFSTVKVPVGHEFSLTLSDGSKVWLNAGSQITFPTRFTGRERNVSVSGEVYFEVAHDARHPFIVTAGQMELTVLGTSFNVMAYESEPEIEATLVTGSLQVEVEGQQLILEPDRQAQWGKEKQELLVRKVYAESYAAWTKGIFVFFDEPVASICRKLSRWYNVEIDASSESLRHMYYSGMIKKYDTFNKVADLMASTDEIVFREEGEKIVVYAKKDL